MKRTVARIGLLLAILGMVKPAVRAEEPTISYAQKLVDMVLAANRQIMTLSIHAIPPGATRYSIIATNVPQLLWKESDSDDLRIIRDNSPVVRESIPSGAFVVTLPMYDVTGKTIGALDIKYRGVGSDKHAVLAATRVRDKLRNIIPTNDALFDQFSYAASDSDDLALHLLAKEVIRHPDLWVLAFHVTPPGDTVNRVIGINYLKIQGKQSEESEEALSKNGNTALEAFPSTHRVETHVPMLDQQGNLIGTLATVYFYQDYEADLPGILARTMIVRDEVMRETPSLAALVAAPVTTAH